LESRTYQKFSEKLILVDACGVYPNFPVTSLNEQVDTVNPNQIVYFASPDGAYTRVGAGLGDFTRVALEVLRRSKTWPDARTFTRDIERDLDGAGIPAFSISGSYPWGRFERVACTLIGEGREKIRSIIELLASKGVTEKDYAFTFSGP